MGNQLLVLGVGEEVRLLKEITDETEYNEYIRQYKEQLERNLQPVDILSKWLKKKTGRKIQTRQEQKDRFIFI
ncbi:hypothetical protein ACI2OX_13065 [Bacillus sp. N9]